MGMSPVATIAYGIDFGFEDIPDNLYEWDDGFLEKLSALPKWGEEDHSFEKQRDFEKALPATVKSYGFEFEGCFLAIPNSILSVEWGSKEISTDLTTPPFGKQAFLEFCEEHGFEGKAGWFLLAEYS